MMRDHLKLLLIAAASLQSLPVSAKEPAPLRIVYETRARMPAMKEVLATRVHQCVGLLKTQGQEVPVPQLPSDEVLGSTPTRITEVLLTPDHEAIYTKALLFFPDAANACRVRALMSYQVLAAQTCERGWRGTGGVMVAMAYVAVAAAPPTLGAVDAKKASCTKNWRHEAPAIKGTGELAERVGLRCYWDDVLLGIPFSHGGRVCVHADYRYPVRKQWWPVLELKTEYVQPPDGFEQMSNSPEWNSGRREAVVFEQGKSIAAERFGEAAVKAFVNQPVWKSLGDL